MKTVYLIGTSHQYQIRRPDVDLPYDAFKLLVFDAVRTHNVALIAEEMSLEALAERQASKSICKDVADDTGLPHCYCDPETAERSALGIEDEQLIRINTWLSARRGTTEAEKHAVS